jgi:hypothetical protein
MYVLYAVAVPIAHNTGRSLSEKKLTLQVDLGPAPEVQMVELMILLP